MQLCLDQANLDDSENALTSDSRVNAAMELPVEARSAEVTVALLRQFLGRRLAQTDPMMPHIEAAFPRTPESITNKSVVAALIGFDVQKHETLIETVARIMLNEYATTLSSGQQEDPRVYQFRASLQPEHQIYELATALFRQFLAVKARFLPAAAHLPAFFEQRFPKTPQSIGKAAVLCSLAQLDAPPPNDDGTSILELYLLHRMTQREYSGDTIEKVPTQHFEYNDDDTVLINGFHVSDQQANAYVTSLDELDFANAVVLGKGAGGSVMKVRHPKSGYIFGVKEILLSEDSIEQVKNEVQVMWGSVKAPIQERCAALIDCFGVFYRAVTLYIVMELMDGSLKDLEKKKRAVDETGCAAIAFQALQGLTFLHDRRRQLHRDIKPHNILYRVSDGAVKVADFGISSKPLETIKNFKQETYCGTVLYMSPQRAAGEPYGYEGDVWSLGVTLLELAMGSLPFQANIYAIDQLRHSPPRLPTVSPFGAPFSPEFQDFIAQCCCPVVGPEYPTAAKLLQHPFLMYMNWEDSRRVVRGFPA